MKIDDEIQALAAVEAWRALSLPVQGQRLRGAIESLELSEMYYAQKNNEMGEKRCAASIAVLQRRLQELGP